MNMEDNSKEKKPVGRPKADKDKKTDFGFVSESDFDKGLGQLLIPLPPKQ